MHGQGFHLPSWAKILSCLFRGQRMISTVQKTYEDAVSALNTLQTNAQVLDKIRQRKQPGCPSNNLPTVVNFLNRADMTVDELDSLNIIHVSGTKGKGSVCALCESVLRACGFKTGFYSSPHLVEVRERIRINGQPTSKQSFADNLFTVYNRLIATKDQFGGEMPAYFRFLTIMAFQIFLQEKVDVAIIEVGLGGAYDCTNIIKNPVAVGITSLGLDHIRVLGDTIDKIAWQKAGICKPNRPAFTVPQPQDGMKTIYERAKELKTSVHCTPNIDEYDFQGRPLKLGLAGDHQRINASLALQLCKTWLEETHPDFISFEDVDWEPKSKRALIQCEGEGDTASACGMPVISPFVVPLVFMQGLQDCYWAGRTQTFKRENVTYYLDGAHTPRSIQACIKWFTEVAEEESKTIDGPVAKALVFNSTGDRKDSALISPLMACVFDGVAFCPNIVTEDTSGNSADQTNYNTTLSKQLNRCQGNNAIYELLSKTSHVHQNDVSSESNGMPNSGGVTEINGTNINSVDLINNEKAIDVTSNGSSKVTQPKEQASAKKVVKKNAVFGCISKALQWLAGLKDSKLGGPLQSGPSTPVPLQNAVHIQILVTGSLHLIGGTVKLLDPKLATMQGGDTEIKNGKTEVQRN
ncbi:folylpolyglutamate synthase, mitochondrial-like [Anneissia japonica]|uniref:folylpolyglutamate synthase, mitochondrial-like n=1 Tax=Anneissia japonica TaxID=1529436 RepID=UPI0014259ACC|nr:folylpolyglutamate synthase, mitochondrial-like [Anneissia japonica]